MKMRTILLALLACLGMSLPAMAGDIALPFVGNTKANAVTPCTLPTATTPLSCSGAYVGGGLAGAGSNANIIGGGIQGSVFAGGMTPSLDVGYQYVQGNWIFAGEFDGGYAFGSNVGGSFNGARISEVFKVGGNLSALLGTQAPITIPAQLASAVIGPYAFVAPTQWQFPGSWANGTGSGAGVLFDFGSRWFGDLRYTYTDFSAAKAIPGVTINNDQSLRFAVNYKLN
jgi:opacity protein-like surface antigen